MASACTRPWFIWADRIDVVAGQEVTPGQAIGAVGSSGRSTGPHLHWEVHVAGAAVDPAVWTWRDFAAIRNGSGFLMPGDQSESSPPEASPQVGAPSAGETGVPPEDVPAG